MVATGEDSTYSNAPIAGDQAAVMIVLVILFVLVTIMPMIGAVMHHVYKEKTGPDGETIPENTKGYNAGSIILSIGAMLGPVILIILGLYMRHVYAGKSKVGVDFGSWLIFVGSILLIGAIVVFVVLVFM